MKQIKIPMEYMTSLTNGCLSDIEKGNLMENIVELLFQKLEWGYDKLTNAEEQLVLGDYHIINKKNKEYYVEVKTSHTFRNKDKQAFDYLYFKYGTQGKIPYIQSNSNNNLGWIYNNKADILITINPISNTLYFIKDYPIVKDNIIKHIEEYSNKVTPYSWCCMNPRYNVIMQPYLEGSTKTDNNYTKESLIVNLELSKKSIEYFGGKLIAIDLISDTDVEIA